MSRERERERTVSVFILLVLFVFGVVFRLVFTISLLVGSVGVGYICILLLLVGFLILLGISDK